MGVMESIALAGDAYGPSHSEEDNDIAAGIDATEVDAIDFGNVSVRDWPAAIAELYFQEVMQRVSREGNFLFLTGMFVCLATIAVDVMIGPAMAKEGVLLRLFVVAPPTLVGLIAVARGQNRLAAFCVGAAPIAFMAVVVHLAVHLPPEIAPRYLYATILLVGLGNVILPYTLRGLATFNMAALIVMAALLGLRDGVANAGEMTANLWQNADTLLVLILASGATMLLAGRFETLRQRNFLLTLRARIFGRELLKANSALRELAWSDPLTGIANRRGFENAFSNRISAQDRHRQNSDFIGLMMIDLDHFKSFNDTHGHQAGDTCLQLVASALVDIFDSADGTVARYGGEEFIAALRASDPDALLSIAEEARHTIAAVLAPQDQKKGSLITASIGVAIAPVSAMLACEELIEMADAALYSGKANGRNRVEAVEAQAILPPSPQLS